MTIIEHLEELRRVLMVSVGAWVVANIGAFFFHDQLLRLLEKPLTDVTGRGRHNVTAPIVTTPTEPLTIPLKALAIVGFAIALPVILWQVWAFVSPGTAPGGAEARMAAPGVRGDDLCGGRRLRILCDAGRAQLPRLGTNAEFRLGLNAYLTFFTILILIFGVTVEFPIAILLLGMLGIVSSSFLRARRKGIWVGIVS